MDCNEGNWNQFTNFFYNYLTPICFQWNPGGEERSAKSHWPDWWPNDSLQWCLLRWMFRYVRHMSGVCWWHTPRTSRPHIIQGIQHTMEVCIIIVLLNSYEPSSQNLNCRCDLVIDYWFFTKWRISLQKQALFFTTGNTLQMTLILEILFTYCLLGSKMTNKLGVC